MRKILYIALSFVCCLLIAGSGNAASRAVRPAVAISVDRASSEQWLCEQRCNSDLNLPRTPGALAVPRVVTASFRCGYAHSVRTVFSGASAPGVAGVVKSTSVVGSVHPVAVTHAVDYYVYCLRRLII